MLLDDLLTLSSNHDQLQFLTTVTLDVMYCFPKGIEIINTYIHFFLPCVTIKHAYCVRIQWYSLENWSY